MSSSGNISPSSSTRLLTATCGMHGGISGQSIMHFIPPPAEYRNSNKKNFKIINKENIIILNLKK